MASEEVLDNKRKIKDENVISAKKPKNIKSKTKDSEDLAKAWAYVLLGTAHKWIYNCDSGCFYDVCQKSVKVEGNWLIIYQPLKSMIEHDELIAAIIIKRTDKKPITQKMFNDAKPFLANVENLYLQSYNDILKVTDNKWTHSVDGTLNQIAQIKEPLNLVDGTLKMKFEIRGAVDGCCGDSWDPSKLMVFIGNSIKYATLNEHGVIQDKEELYKFNKIATPAIFS